MSVLEISRQFWIGCIFFFLNLIGHLYTISRICRHGAVFRACDGSVQLQLVSLVDLKAFE